MLKPCPAFALALLLGSANALSAGGPRPTAPLASGAAAFEAARRFADLPCGRIAYLDRGTGEAALFLHGAPLNSYQWRGVIDRLAPYRRCLAPDFMGLGYSEPAPGQGLGAKDQMAMLVALLDKLGLRTVDIVASDSGTAVAQLLLAAHPERVRTLLLTDGDVEPDSPPAGVKPAIDLARAGKLADATAAWLKDPAQARATFGAAVYADPSRLSAETIRAYVAPLVASPVRRAQYEAFHLALEPNPLAGLAPILQRSQVPVRIVWGAEDTIFAKADAEYLDRLFPRSEGIRWVPGGKLFFQEEHPEIVAEEALKLWRLP